MLDYVTHQASINRHQARLDSDGRFRAVVCASDPGAPNWLDSCGHRTGAILARWRDASSAPTPSATLVTLAELRDRLPTDTPTVDARGARAGPARAQPRRATAPTLVTTEEREGLPSTTGTYCAGSLHRVRILDLTSLVMGTPGDAEPRGPARRDDLRRGGGRRRDPLPRPGQASLSQRRRAERPAQQAQRRAEPEASGTAMRPACGSSRPDDVVTDLRPGPRRRLDLTYDDVIQAAGGTADLFVMQSGTPSIAPMAVADQVASLTIMSAIFAALYHRTKTGEGQSIGIPTVATMAAFAPCPSCRAPAEDATGPNFFAGGIADAHDDPRLRHRSRVTSIISRSTRRWRKS